MFIILYKIIGVLIFIALCDIAIPAIYRLLLYVVYFIKEYIE